MVKTEDTYESMYLELDEIIQLLQSGELNLDEAVKKYERSRELIIKLEKHLETVQNKITKIKADLK
jgi:exodeoxyribonuclease VII small subunit